MTQRTEDLAAVRRLLLALSEGLIRAGRLLTETGLADDGRAVSHMGTEVVAVRKRVRSVHNAALAAERSTTATEENR